MSLLTAPGFPRKALQKGGYMTGSPDRNNNFNLIRLMAALGVMTTHAPIVTGGMDAVQPMAPWLMGLTLGTLCVYAFFTVSGYLLTASLMANPDPLRFVTRRCARIFPALLLVTLSSLVVGAVLTREDGSTFLSGVPQFLLKNLTLTDFNHGLPGVFSQNPIPTTFNIPLLGDTQGRYSIRRCPGSCSK